MPIGYVLSCDRERSPIAVEVFEGSLHNDKTSAQAERLRQRLGLMKVVSCLDQVMVTAATERELAPIGRWVEIELAYANRARSQAQRSGRK